MEKIWYLSMSFCVKLNQHGALVLLSSLAFATNQEKGSGTSLIQELNTASKLAEMVASVEVELRLAGSLEYAGFQVSDRVWKWMGLYRCHAPSRSYTNYNCCVFLAQESKLQAIFAAAIKGHSDLALHATSFIPVLLDFHYNDHPKCHEHHGEVR